MLKRVLFLNVVNAINRIRRSSRQETAPRRRVGASARRKHGRSCAARSSSSEPTSGDRNARAHPRRAATCRGSAPAAGRRGFAAPHNPRGSAAPTPHARCPDAHPMREAHTAAHISPATRQMQLHGGSLWGKGRAEWRPWERTSDGRSDHSTAGRRARREDERAAHTDARWRTAGWV